MIVEPTDKWMFQGGEQFYFPRKALGNIRLRPDLPQEFDGYVPPGSDISGEINFTHSAAPDWPQYPVRCEIFDWQCFRIRIEDTAGKII
jgi:hypothetical protein